ncbi:hypothetical protein OG921_16750, partial [Aldersonia sp. NBC_00410]
MPGFYRAYGQLRRGGGPWRSPFLIPLVANANPVGFPTEDWHFAIDAGAVAADVDAFLTGDGNLIKTLYDYLSSGNLTLTFTIRPSTGRVVRDITVRIVVLVSSADLTVDSGEFDEEGAQFAAFELRVGPGTSLPRIDLTVGIRDARINPQQVDLANSLTVAAGGVAVSSISLTVDPNVDIPVDMAGGLVDADVTRLPGVETSYVPLLNQYSERSRDVRGVDLRWLDDPVAPRPASATWVRLAGNPMQPVPQLRAILHTPIQPDPPTNVSPTVAALDGGSMRPGV